MDCLLKNARLVVPRQGIFEGSVAIRDGVVAAIHREPFVGVETAVKVIDVGGRYVLPGVIEPHSHLGRGSLTDDFRTESWTAALGGVTTMFSYYTRPTTYHELFPTIKQAVEERAYIDFGFHFNVARDNHLDEIDSYAERCGVRSFKFNMARSGEDAAGPPEAWDDGLMHEGFSNVARVKGGLACVHAENVLVIWRFRNRIVAQGREDLAAWSESRPNFCEAETIHRAYYYGQLTGCPTYIVHLTTKEGLQVVKEWKKKFPAAYVETCPHYLTHTMNAPEGKLAKATPPLRTEADIEALWSGLLDGTIDTMGSDHVVLTREQKMIGIWESRPGFPGVTTMLPVLLSEGVNRRGLSLQRVAEVTSYNTARIFGLYPKKGTIQVGSDADFTVVDLDVERTVRAAELGSFSDFSIYEGHTLKGWPVLTMVRGQVVMQDGQIVGQKGWGQYLYR
ncbi:MAG: amidohydrolase family protein [Chloroflexi bacterium]|nr:amidohydrolase family protein [Chloroflexota bacterium]